MWVRDNDNRWTLLASAAAAIGPTVVAALASRKPDTTLAERVALLGNEVKRLKDLAGP